MTGEEDQARLIAERIARRVGLERGSSAGTISRPSGGDIRSELSAMRASLDNLQTKLIQIESRLSRDDSFSRSDSSSLDQYDGAIWAPSSSGKSSSSVSQFASTYAPASHPSQERFGVEEATVAELVDFFEGEKKCELEPGGKTCDHCAMCSSRGF
jgi:hypothetical protein